ncbi:MAG: hypothetical protein MI799_02870, partial [Desulfobacterales bacterium]|nr:hypothetical protein [Desulfobacterales bacterium]
MNLIKKIIAVCLVSLLYAPSLWGTGPFPDANKRKLALSKVNPKVVYVNQHSRADCPDGSSWAKAFPSLFEALKSNLRGKTEIWVARGTYYPTDNTQREASFTLVSGVGIYGGFMGSELLRSQRDWGRNATVLSGEIGDPARLSDNAYHVVTGADNAVIDGFIIRDGYALPGEGENDDSGCLVKVPEKMAGTEDLDSVTNMKFSSGGGLLNLHAGTYARNCRFLSNYAVNGGAAYNMVTRYWDPDHVESTPSAPPPVFENCIFEDNHAISLGGAVCNAFFTRSVFAGCIFSDNSCKGKGGAVYGDMGSPVYMMNVLFNNNEAERGAALAAEGASSHRLIFATFTCNMAYDIGAALYQGAYMNEQADGTPFIGNEIHLYRSLVLSNVSISSPTSISSWHDSTVTFDAESVVEDVDGTIAPGPYLGKDGFASKSVEAGFNPARKINIGYWINRFDGDENRTYYKYDYDTSSRAGEPGIIYVNYDAPPGGDGSSWAMAFCDLNLALEKAAAGSQVWVAKGVYTPIDGPDRSA